MKNLLKRLANVKLVAFDFDGIMTDGFVYVDYKERESVRCSRKDGMGIKMLKEAGIKVVVISTERNLVVLARCKKLNIECVQGVDTGKDKLDVLKDFLSKHNLSQKEVCYVGDDINDIECLDFAEVGITVADGNEENKKNADYITERNGGNHAVREICDLILKSRKEDKSNGNANDKIR
mgnify:CR=1 FL=1